MKFFNFWLQYLNRGISNNMEFEDNRNALFVEPNAYVQDYKRKKNTPQKIVFREPYECMPNYHVDNGFKKKDCDCVNKKNHDKPCNKSQQGGGFDFKAIMPMLTGLIGGTNLGSIASLLNGKGLDFSKVISTILSDKNSLSAVAKLFQKGGSKTENSAKPKSTDFQIKDYTRV